MLQLQKKEAAVGIGGEENQVGVQSALHGNENDLLSNYMESMEKLL